MSNVPSMINGLGQVWALAAAVFFAALVVDCLLGVRKRRLAMKVTVNGIDIPNPAAFDVRVALTSPVERLPKVHFAVTGGHLDVYRSDVDLTGDVRTHVFGETGVTVVRLTGDAPATRAAGGAAAVNPHVFGDAPPASLAGLMTAACDDILGDLDKLDGLDPAGAEAPEEAALMIGLTMKVRELRDMCSVARDPATERAATAPIDAAREQAFREGVNLVIDKLIELTPYRAIAHASYGMTQGDLDANATQIVAQLKDSPTLAAITKTLTGESK